MLIIHVLREGVLVRDMYLSTEITIGWSISHYKYVITMWLILIVVVLIELSRGAGEYRSY